MDERLIREFLNLLIEKVDKTEWHWEIKNGVTIYTGLIYFIGQLSDFDTKKVEIKKLDGYMLSFNEIYLVSGATNPDLQHLVTILLQKIEKKATQIINDEFLRSFKLAITILKDK